MSQVDQILEIARAELGVTEYPSGSNKCKYNTWYYGREVSGSDYPWCMVFVQWVFAQAGLSDLLLIKTASCGTLRTYAQNAGLWITSGYKPGDVLIYDNPSTSASQDHTGICVSATATTVTAIEGNTSVSNASNGGEVAEMTRNINKTSSNKLYVVGALRPQYAEEKEEEETMTDADFKAAFDRMVANNKAEVQTTFSGLMTDYLATRQDNDCGAWSAEARDWAVDTGLIQGGGTTSDGQTNYMWEDFLTREQFATVLYRYDQSKG